MPFLYVGVGGMSELVVPTYYVGRQAHLCESRRVLQVSSIISELGSSENYLVQYVPGTVGSPHSHLIKHSTVASS